MEEILKLVIEGGSFGVSLLLVHYLFKRFVKKEVIEPIKELQEGHDKIEKGFVKFTEGVNSFIFRIIKSHNDVAESVNKNVTGMNQLFMEATRHTSQSKLESAEALEKVNVLHQTAEKLMTIATKVHDKNAKLESEVQKLNHDMILIKSKMGMKKE